MTWVVDTCIVIDVVEADPDFGVPSVRALERRLDEGLVLSPISFVELAPVFDGSRSLLREFMAGAGIDLEPTFTEADRDAAHSAWGRYVAAKRRGTARRRPAADALIGALAMRSDGIITRNPDHFRVFYPEVVVVDPTRRAR